MKKYLSTEVRRIAQNVTTKKNKQFFDELLNDVMFLIEEAARSGKYSIEFSVEDQPINIKETFYSMMKEYGYNVTDKTIDWSCRNYAI